ncbi:MAG: MFS transporter, partial [bacterium]
EKSGEFFGFWGLFAKLAAITGIFSFGTIANISGSRPMAVLMTTIFFFTGLILLSFVREPHNPESQEN